MNKPNRNDRNCLTRSETYLDMHLHNNCVFLFRTKNAPDLLRYLEIVINRVLNYLG